MCGCNARATSVLFGRPSAFGTNRDRTGLGACPKSSWQSFSHAHFSAWETLRATRIDALDRDGAVGGNTAKPLGHRVSSTLKML